MNIFEKRMNSDVTSRGVHNFTQNLCFLGGFYSATIKNNRISNIGYENTLIEKWKIILQKNIKNQFNSMRRRLQAVIDARGSNTKY